MIKIIDYGMGNLQSVANAIEALQADFEIARKPEDLDSAKGIILPGVGAFADGMRNLQDRGFVSKLNQLIIDKKIPYLGICLGMQFLADYGLEHGKHEGLGWIKGKVRLISQKKHVKIPHMGWNDTKIRLQEGLYKDFDKESVFYYVHSYFFEPKVDRSVTATTCHGEKLVSSVQQDNIFGVQFHPEKSQGAGLRLLKNFIDVVENGKN